MTPAIWKRLAILGFILSAIALIALNRDQLNPDALDDLLSRLGIWAPLAHVALYAVGTVLFAPGSVLTLVGGAVFGPIWGTFLNLLGATIGAGVAFVIARYAGADWVSAKMGGKLRRLVDGVEGEGWRFVAFVRLVPLFPFNLTNYALGLTRIPLSAYLVTSFITMAPGALAFTWLGYAGRQAASGNGLAIRYGLLSLGLLVAIAFVPRLLARFRAAAPLWIEVEELRDLMAKDDRPLLLDVRNPEEFNGPMGHIEGALNVPLSQLDLRLSDLKDRAGFGVVVLCLTDRRSVQADIALRNAGFSSTRVLRGGMTLWLEGEQQRTNTTTA